MMSDNKKDIGDVVAEAVLNLLRSIKLIFEKTFGGGGKKIYNWIILLAVIVLGAMAVNFVNIAVKPKAAMKTDDEVAAINDVKDKEFSNLESLSHQEKKQEELKNFISLMVGGGNIQVAMRLDGSAEKIVAVNTVKSESETEEDDTSGGKRKIKSNQYTKSVVTLNEGDKSSALITKVLEPKVLSVIAVVEKKLTQEDLTQIKFAIMKLYGLRSGQVEVFSTFKLST